MRIRLAFCASVAVPVLRGFNRNAKQDSEGSEATGGMRLCRMLPERKIVVPTAHLIFELFPMPIRNSYNDKERIGTRG
jgi:hypothetical protein